VLKEESKFIKENFEKMKKLYQTELTKRNRGDLQLVNRLEQTLKEMKYENTMLSEKLKQTTEELKDFQKLYGSKSNTKSNNLR
jgi:predicted nuclease with TOPRIM domain